MRALCWHGPRDVRVETVPDPGLINPRDAIIRVTSAAICGSDLHLYNGLIPTMYPGDILGHEFMGEVVDVGRAVRNLNIGDRVVVPAILSCGGCYFCQRGRFSLCDNSNPNAGAAEKLYGFSSAGIFGCSHLFGGYAGGQAEYVRVPFADVGPMRVPEGIPDEQLLFLTDIFPTGFMAADFGAIEPGDVVAVWGCGPVGQFAIKSAFLFGAERVIAIDRVPERLTLAAEASGAEPLDFDRADVYDALRDLTGGRGPDVCIDAVGMEAHGLVPMGALDRVRQAMRLENDRPAALRQIIRCCRKGGNVSIAGRYSGLVDGIPMGAAMNKGLAFRTWQVDVHRYQHLLLDHILTGKIDPSFVITHELPLEHGPDAYDMFNQKQDGCVKVVLDPTGRRRGPAREALRHRTNQPKEFAHEQSR